MISLNLFSLSFFIENMDKDENIEDNIDQISRKAYILSYKDISKAKSKKDKENKFNEIIKEWWKSKDNSNKVFKDLIANIENDFKKKLDDTSWIKKKFENKRLWAALRDYLEPSYKMNEIFLNAVNETKPDVTFFKKNKNKIMRFVEFPGDIWNIRFAEKTIGNFAKSNEKELLLKNFTKRKSGEELKDSLNFSKIIRTFYDQVIYEDKKLCKDYYPAQMDISYDFASRMCSKCKFENINIYCPFGSGEEINKLCIGNNSKKIGQQYCPLLLMTCGYRYLCKKEGCPILEEDKKGIEICNRD
jgi:hypothetical protein